MSSNPNSDVWPEGTTTKIDSGNSAAKRNENETLSHHSSKENVQNTSAKTAKKQVLFFINCQLT